MAKKTVAKPTYEYKEGFKLSSRPDRAQIQELEDSYLDDSLYRQMRPHLSLHYQIYELLQPAEMWCEARIAAEVIWDKEHPVDRVGVIFDQLSNDYYGIKQKETPMPSFEVWDEPYNDHHYAASEVMWCLYAMLSPLAHDAQKELTDAILEKMGKWKVEFRKVADAAVKEAMNDKDYNPFSFIDKPRAIASGIKKYQNDVVETEAVEPKEQRTHGVHMLPALAMMERLWSPFKQSKLSDKHRAEFLSILTGWSKDAIYNTIVENKDGYNLSETWHQKDIERINKQLLQMGVMRPIKINNTKK